MPARPPALQTPYQPRSTAVMHAYRRLTLLRIWFRRYAGAQAQPSSKPRYRQASLIKLEFTLGGLRVHLLALGDRQGLRFQIGSGQPVAPLPSRHRSCPHKPFFQDANATEAPFV